MLIPRYLDPVLQDDFRLLNEHTGFERGNEKNEAVYVMRIVKTLQFLSYFEICRKRYIYDDDDLFDIFNDLFSDVLKQCPNLTFKVDLSL